jgi:hypothetical protein
MPKNEGNTTKIMISGAVMLLLMVALISALATQTVKNTSLTSTENELVNIAPARLASGEINTTYSFTLTNAPTGWKTETTDCNIQNVVYGNSTTDYTVTTDYTISTAGVLQLKNTAVMNNSASNSTYIDYSYCGNEYLNSSWGRSILNNTIGFFIIAILVVAVFIAYQILGKETED